MNQQVYSQDQGAISVSALNHQVKHLLESSIGRIDVEGEISNFTRAASGHWYFSLKDDTAHIACAMFARANTSVQEQPKNGDKVIVQATVTLYAARGNYQLLVDSMRLAGMGQWHLAYAELYKKLADEGLFASENKKPLPRFPQRLGVISSSHGAALQDILRTAQRRFPALPITVYPSSVQGQQAEGELIHALQQAQRDHRCDVLILARGGGSIEDLWSFNLESVAREIYNCSLVTVSAVGHETDLTIADFVADVRASTPTAAAEIVTPDGEELMHSLAATREHITRSVNYRIDSAQQGVDQLKALLKHPGQKITLQWHKLEQLRQQLQWSIETKLKQSDSQLQRLRASLQQLDYKKVLGRGYVLAKNAKGDALTSATQARQEGQFTLQFHDGDLPVRTE